MADRVRVDPVDLRMSAGHLAMHSEDLRTAHASADSDIDATQAGWAGASAAAMRAKLAEWQEFTDRVCADLDAHQDSFLSAAAKYESADDAGAQSINASDLP